MGHYTWFDPQIKANRDLTKEEIAWFHRPEERELSDVVPFGLSLVGKKEEFFTCYDSVKAYHIDSDIEAFLLHLPKDVKLSGLIYCYGEESTDIWAIEIGGNNEVNVITPDFDGIIKEHFNKERKWKDENSNSTTGV